MMRKKPAKPSPKTATPEALRAVQIIKLQLAIDEKAGRLISRDLVRTEWTTHLREFFLILERSLDAATYSSIAKQCKSYLHTYAK
jgi:hypothetical protein